MSKGLMLGGPFLTCNRIPSKFYLSCEWKIYLNGTYLIKNAYHFCINTSKKSIHVIVYKLAKI